MKVSIIIPIYKVENEIKRCLASVFSQDYESIEVILVNDATPDRSFIIAKEFIETTQPKVQIQYLEHTVNHGLSAARNTGIQASTGDYLFFLDSDDELATSKSIGSLVEKSIIDGIKQDVVMGGYIRIGFHRDREFSFNNQIYSSNKDIYFAYAKQVFNDYAWGKLINRSFLVSHQLFFIEKIYFEDVPWAFKLYRVANHLCTIEQVVCHYYEREGSITAHFSEKWIRDYNQVVVLLYEAYLRNPDYFPKQTIQIIEKRKRDSLRHLFAYQNSENQAFIQEQLEILRSIRLPLSWHNLKYIEQNLILNLPYPIMMRYFKKKWGKRKFGNF